MLKGMAAVQPIRQQSYECIYALLRSALLNKRCIAANYKGLQRIFCPVVIGRSKDERLLVLCYQVGGRSRSGLKAAGSPDNWRCFELEKLTGVRESGHRWYEPENHSRPQTCIARVELDANIPETLTRSASG